MTNPVDHQTTLAELADTAADRSGEPRPGPVARVLVGLVTVYRMWIGPLLPPSCRFSPSCSAYALEALTVHGAARGSWLALRRLSRCGPWHPGGYDPVPPPDAGRRRDPQTSDPGDTVRIRDRDHQTPAEE